MKFFRTKIIGIFRRVPVFRATTILVLWNLATLFATAQLKSTITSPPNPDNIISANCYGPPAATTWSIKEAWKSTTKVVVARPWYVGDLDGDNLPEIVAMGTAGSDAAGYTTVIVFPGNDRNNPKTITTLPYCNYEYVSSIALLRYNNKGMIVVAGGNSDMKLHAYEYPSGTKLWSSDQNICWGANLQLESPSLGVVDFNGDGIPEIYAGSRIFSAADGKFICGGGASSAKGFSVQSSATNGSALSMAVDFDLDAYPELVCGNQVYKVNIAGKTMTSYKTVTPPTLPDGMKAIADGHVSVADLNGDGTPDVVVSLIQPDAVNPTDLTKARAVIYGWDVKNNTLLFRNQILNAVTKSVPFIGDIDGDKKLEILIMAQPTAVSTDCYIYAYKLPSTFSATSQLSQFWKLGVDELAGRTGITLFDFNQDGKSELIYRDQIQLRIIDGSMSTPKDLYTTPSTSATTWEYPVVADVDNDGAAEIVCAGGNAGENRPGSGYMSIYKSAGSKWAPARPVWNQYAYNAVNINKDLTIPFYSFNPATRFAGADQVPGTSDDVFPFNAFLQQQTLLSQDGVPFFLLPNVQQSAESISISGSDDALKVKVKVTNAGDAATQSPLFITVYKDAMTASGIKYTYSYPNVIGANQSVDIEFSIPNFESWAGTVTANTHFYININDKGGANADQQVCKPNLPADMTLQKALAAINDYTQTLKNVPVTVDPLKNDFLGVCSKQTITLSLVTPPVKGNATVDLTNKTVIYTPTTNFTGMDSLTYRITCQSQSADAKIYIIVLKDPDNIDPLTCYMPQIQKPLDIKLRKEVRLNHCQTSLTLVGDMDGDGKPEIVMYDSNAWPAPVSNLDTIKIFDANLNIKKQFPVANFSNIGSDRATPVHAIANLDGGKESEVIVFSGYNGGSATDAYRLVCYGYNGVEKWRSSVPIFSPSMKISQSPTISIGDINNDGIPEVLTYDKVFDGITGNLLVTLPVGGRGIGYNGFSGETLYMPVLADMDNDGKLEVVAGNTVYKLNLVSRTNASLNSAVISVQLPGYEDGFTSVADIDLDGYLDVVVAVGQTGYTLTEGKVYAWSPVNQSVLIPALVADFKVSRVTLADVNRDNSPELIFVSNIGYACYSYNPTAKTYSKLWETPFFTGWATSSVAFDLNQDLTPEIFVRSEEGGGFLDGATGSFIGEVGYYSEPNCSSPINYSVVADIDLDGHAEIIQSSENNRLGIYESATPNAWASARSVWNQHAYNAVHVNDDLTIPQYQLNPSMQFTGGDCGTQRPYNAFLEQVGIIDPNGCPIIPLPDFSIDGASGEYIAGSDIAEFTLTISNSGVSVNPPIYISFYKSPAGAASLLAVDEINEVMTQGSTITRKFIIHNYSSLNYFGDVVIRINDKGDFPYYYMDECNTDNNTATIKLGGSALNDYIITPINTSIQMDVLVNDLVSCQSSGTLTVKKSPVNGTAQVVSGKIVYTPNHGYQGLDSVKYNINCSATESYDASAYIYVYPNISQACSNPGGNPFKIAVNDIKNQVTIHWTYASGDTHGQPVGSSADAFVSMATSGTDTYLLNAAVQFPPSVGSVLLNEVTNYYVNIVPELMYWNKLAQNNDWNDPSNWTDVSGKGLNSVPMSCTDVHIPGNANNYPNLNTNYTIRNTSFGEPVCNNITFHFGGEVARQDFLTYNKAYIQYNFGYYDGSNSYKTDGDAFSAVPMSRGRWYALSAPLKKISSGDFSVGGFPNFWQRGFKSSEGHAGETLSGEWYVPDNNNAREVGANQNYAISIWAGEYLSGVIGEEDQDSLNVLKGVLEMPYFENPTVSSLHRVHSYNGIESSFRYYWSQQVGMPLADTMAHPQGTIVRGQEAYRFVIEDNSNKPPVSTYQMTVPAGEDIMIGNPFVSSLDFLSFYQANSSNIESYYRLFTGSGFTTYPITTTAPPLVASFQGFFIKTKGTGTVTLNFPLVSSVTRVSGSAHQLKAPSAVMDNVLKLGVRNSYGSNAITLALNSDWASGNIPQMFIQESQFADDAKNYIQIYAKGRDGLKSSVICESGSKLEIPVGVVGSNADSGELFVENVQNLNAQSLVLLDCLTDKRQDLMANPVYKFTNNPTYTHDRFILYVNGLGAPTDINSLSSQDVNIYTEGHTLYVKSEEEISEVRINTVHGAYIYGTKVGYPGTFMYEIPFSTGVYLVTVTLSSREIRTEKVIVK